MTFISPSLSWKRSFRFLFGSGVSGVLCVVHKVWIGQNCINHRMASRQEKKQTKVEETDRNEDMKQRWNECQSQESITGVYMSLHV